MIASAVQPLPTVFVRSERLVQAIGLEVVLAVEAFQHTGSFKFRAASHVAASVPHVHVLAVSSGNFGQAIAYACQLTGKRCTVVMPETSARVKIDGVRGYGAEVDLIDTRKVGRTERVAQLAERWPEAYVASAFDDPLVVEGNASLGREIAAAGVEWDTVIAPVGGGGLAAGLALGLEQGGSRAALIAAEPEMANDAARSLREGRLLANDGEPPTLADGARTSSLGVHPWEVLRHRLRDVIEVPEEGIRHAVRSLFLLANVKAEPTGGLALAAVERDPARFAGQRVCCVVSGGNVDAATYVAMISE